MMNPQTTPRRSLLPIGEAKQLPFSEKWSHDVGYSIADDREIVVATVYGETANQARAEAEVFAKAVNAGLLSIKYEGKGLEGVGK